MKSVLTTATALILPTFCIYRSSAAETRVPVIIVRARRYKFSPSEITLKQGQKVKVVFVSDDVPHGVVVDDLGIDLDIEKTRSSEVTITPVKVGDFKGRCSRCCGGGHTAMTFVVHVAG